MRNGKGFPEVDSNPDWRRGKRTDSILQPFLQTRSLNVFAESISVAWEYLGSSSCTAEKRRLRLRVQQSGHASWCGTFAWRVHWCLGVTSRVRRVVSDSSY